MASSFTFAVADILCDICITENGEKAVHTAADDDDDTHMGLLPVSDKTRSSIGPEEAYESDVASDRGGSTSDLLRSKRLSGQRKAEREECKASLSAVDDEAESAGWTGDRALADDRELGGGTLSGEQDAAIAGLVTTVLVVIANIYWGILARHAAYEGAPEVPRLRWGPTTHFQFWLAMIGGAMNFLHYYFLLKAFEGAPSTVLLPLVQVASVSVLLGSAAIASLRHEQWITPTHALAYCLMFVGGVLPACGGHLSALLQPAFWRQPFVSCAILAEFALGVHDLMLSGCAYHAEAHAAGGSGEGFSWSASDDSYEYFVWSRLSFVATFVTMYALSPRLWAELRGLFEGAIALKYITLSALSEGLTVVGFYLASIAYGLFYQAGVVHAAEASLSQLFNLFLAFVLLNVFGVGRQSSVGSMPAKLASFVLVTIGLFLCTLEETGHAPPVAVADYHPAVQGLPSARNGTAWRALAALEEQMRRR